MQSALTIAGSDSGGGAGIQADLKTFEAHGIFGTSVIAAITAQNTKGVEAVEAVSTEMVTAQLHAILSDFRIGAAKTGMLFSEKIIRAVAKGLRGHSLPLVVDPVMVATSGDPLLEKEAIEAIRKELLPKATVVTPNLREAELLSGLSISSRSDMISAAEKIARGHPNLWVLVKGFHLREKTEEKSDEVADLLYFRGGTEFLSLPFIDTPNTHGTGCTLSAAIAANLTLGKTVQDAVWEAKKFTHEAIVHSWANLGQGNGTLRHNHISLPPK